MGLICAPASLHKRDCSQSRTAYIFCFTTNIIISLNMGLICAPGSLQRKEPRQTANRNTFTNFTFTRTIFPDFETVINVKNTKGTENKIHCLNVRFKNIFGTEKVQTQSYVFSWPGEVWGGFVCEYKILASRVSL